MGLKILVDLVDWVEWLWENHWVQIANAFAVLLVLGAYSLLNDAWGRRMEERTRRDYERHERIKKAALKKAREIEEEERRKDGSGRRSSKGRRIFKVVSGTSMYLKSREYYEDTRTSFQDFIDRFDSNILS